jgi:hypothetical protein
MILWVYVALFPISAVMTARLGSYPTLPNGATPNQR